jgi:hypothetical protein
VSALGLGGSVDREVKRTLYELFQIRNVVVHRACIADRRLVEECARLGLKQGEEVRINHAAYHGYLEAIDAYFTCLLKRLADHFGVDMKLSDGQACHSCALGCGPVPESTQ